MKHLRIVVIGWAREVVVSIVTQRVGSAMTLLVVLGATATVIGTAGRNAGAEGAVLAKIDARGTRSLTVYAQGQQPDFSSALVPQLASYDVVEEVVGFGPVTDVTAAANVVGPRVGLRTAYGAIGGRKLIYEPPIAGLHSTLANEAAITVLGLPARGGSVRSVDDGPEWLITGEMVLPENLVSMGPALVAAGNPEEDVPLASLIILAKRPEDLPLVTRLVAGALRDIPPDKLKVESSQQLADLRAVIGGELSLRSRSIILSVLAGSATAILMIAWSLALMRRRDFGRRRALGATRSMIVSLIVSQTFLLATVGALLGSVVGLGLLTLRSEPLPTARFVVALIIMYALTTAAAAAIPATWAANRDPLRELRVP